MDMKALKKKEVKHSLECIKPIIERHVKYLEREIILIAEQIRTLSVQLTNNGIDADVMEAFIMHGIVVQIEKIKENEVKKDA